MQRQVKLFTPNTLKQRNGFTLLESIMVILLITVLSFSFMPVMHRLSLFKERFFIDQLLSMLHQAQKIAFATGCEIQVKYANPVQLGVYQRALCKSGEFSRLIPSPFMLSDEKGLVISIPKAIDLKELLPIYMDSNGMIYNKKLMVENFIKFQVNKHHFVIEGTSGLVYETDQ